MHFQTQTVAAVNGPDGYILDNVVIIPVEIMQYRDQCQLLNKQTDYPLHVEVE